MEGSGSRPNEPGVALGDSAVATEIAQGCAARRRVAAALRVAGRGVRPALLVAERGQRLLLLPPGAAGGKSRGRAILGLVGVGVVLVAAAAGASLLENDKGDNAANSL